MQTLWTIITPSDVRAKPPRPGIQIACDACQITPTGDLVVTKGNEIIMLFGSGQWVSATKGSIKIQ